MANFPDTEPPFAIAALPATGQPDQPPLQLFPTANPRTDTAALNEAFDDGKPVEIGLQFKLSGRAKLHSIRFWSSPGEVGSRRLRLWDCRSGNLLKEYSTNAVIPENWNPVFLPDHVILPAGTYIVSVLCQRYYPARSAAFLVPKPAQGILQALNGVFTYETNAGFKFTSTPSFYYIEPIVIPTGDPVLLPVREHLALDPLFQESFEIGDPNWQVKLENLATEQIETAIYAASESVKVGETIEFHLHGAVSGKARLEIHRLGYYGGTGAKLVATIADLDVSSQAEHMEFDAETHLKFRDGTDTGLIIPNRMTRANWTEASRHGMTIPNSWRTGIYQAKVTLTDGENQGKQSYTVFVVRDDQAIAEILFQLDTNSWDAYNGFNFPGQPRMSLYGGNHGRAFKVSKDRPYAQASFDQAVPTAPLRWHPSLVHFLERFGYRVAYCTNWDIHRFGADYIKRHRVFLTNGHDEYWSRKQYEAVQSARDAGVHIINIGSNTAYWRIRYEDNGRTLVCHKNNSHGGVNADDQPVANDLIKQLIHQLPDAKQLVQKLLEAFPEDPPNDPLDTDALIQKLIANLPQTDQLVQRLLDALPPGVRENVRQACQVLRPTVRFRDGEIDDAECRLWGVQYVNNVGLEGFAWEATNVQSSANPNGDPLYAGTGFQEGDRLSHLMGYEWDNIDEKNLPPGIATAADLRILSHSVNPAAPARNKGIFDGWKDPAWESSDLIHKTGKTVFFKHPDSGACVFSTGANNWSWGLAPRGLSYTYISHTADDIRLQRLFQNILAEMKVWGAFPLLPVVTAPAIPAIKIGEAVKTTYRFGIPLNRTVPSSIASAVPAGAPYSFGHQFTAEVDCQLTQVMVHMPLDETGDHSVWLWDTATKTQLQKFSIASYTPGTWITIPIAPAIPLQAGKSYLLSTNRNARDNRVAGVYSPPLHYGAVTYQGCYETAEAPLDTYPMQALTPGPELYFWFEVTTSALVSTLVPVELESWTAYPAGETIELGTRFTVSEPCDLLGIALLGNDLSAAAPGLEFTLWNAETQTQIQRQLHPIAAAPQNDTLLPGYRIEARFDAPIRLTPGKPYVASVDLRQAAGYLALSHALRDRTIARGMITVEAGVYGASGSCPSEEFNDSWYSVDVMIRPTSPS